MGSSNYLCFHSTTFSYFLYVCLHSAWHARVQVVTMWGCPVGVKCPLGTIDCRAASAASFTATNLMEVGGLRTRGYGMSLPYTCVFRGLKAFEA